MVRKAADAKAKRDAKAGIVPEDPSLKSVADSTHEAVDDTHDEDEYTRHSILTAEDVFGKSEA